MSGIKKQLQIQISKIALITIVANVRVNYQKFMKGIVVSDSAFVFVHICEPYYQIYIIVSSFEVVN